MPKGSGIVTRVDLRETAGCGLPPRRAAPRSPYAREAIDEGP